VRNAKLILVLLPLVAGFLLNRFVPALVGWLPLLAWVFLVLWAGFGLWLGRSNVNRPLAFVVGLGAPVLFLLFYLATVGTELSIYPQLYFLAFVPAATQVQSLIGDPVHTAVEDILTIAAILVAAAFVIGFLCGWLRFRSRSRRRMFASY